VFGHADFLQARARRLGLDIQIATVGATGLTYLVYAIVITLTLVLITTVFCMWIFRMPFDESIGVVSGATGNPAILAFASRTAPTDKPDVGYAMIFPSMTIGKILFIQIAATLLARCKQVD
jgi:putative transport protein